MGLSSVEQETLRGQFIYYFTMEKDLTKNEVLRIANKIAEFQNNPNIKIEWKGKGQHAEYFHIEVKSEQVKLVEKGLKFLNWVLAIILTYIVLTKFIL